MPSLTSLIVHLYPSNSTGDNKEHSVMRCSLVARTPKRGGYPKVRYNKIVYVIFLK